MPPKQRCAAAGSGQQSQKPTGKQELREQEQEAEPSPPDATSETKTPGSNLHSEFERVMEELKCSCPTIIQLVGEPVLLGKLDNITLSPADVSRLAKKLSKHSSLKEINLKRTCVEMLVEE
jgi:hypothetical protein